MTDYKSISRAAFDAQAEHYDEANFGHHARDLYPVMLTQLMEIPHGTVLDVGCGTGELLRQLLERAPETACAGLDLSEKMLSVAREKLGDGVELVLGDAEELPFEDGRFEAVLCNDSFHHYPRPEKALAEMARVLQPGGVLLLGDCTAPAGAREAMNLLLPLGHSGDVKLYSAEEMRRLLEREFHGVECRKIGSTSFFAWGIR